MTSDLAKLMEYIDSLQSEPTPEPVIEEVEETKVHPLLQAMHELKEEGIVEAKESIKDQIEKAFIVDGGNIDEYFVRSASVDKIGYSPKQVFGRSPDVDDPNFSVDYIGRDKGKPALWFYPLSFYLKSQPMMTYATDMPYVWLVRIRPSAWLQPVGSDKVTKQDAPTGKERVGLLRKSRTPAAIFFKPAFDVVDKFYDYGSEHKRHGEVKGAPVDEEIAYHGTTDDINKFRPFTHFGTEKAAKDRMTYKKIKDGKIYKVDLNIKNPLTIKDFPGIHYDRLYAFELKDKRLISQEEMEEITFTQDKDELRQKLLNKLNELGIDGFVYKNKYEDKGNISYVIVDPSQVKVLSVEPATENVTEDNHYTDQIEDFLFSLGPDDVGVEEIGPYRVHFEGFSDWCQQDALERCSLPKTDPRHLSSYEAVYDDVLNDFIKRENGKQPIDSGLTGDEEYPVYYAIFKTEELTEASPNTLAGSFTPDLVESKTWLAKMLAKGLKGKNAGTIYVLGSWYGNMGIFLQQAGIKFDKLVLVEPDEKSLMRSKELLDTLNDEGKLVLIHQKAEDVVYEKPSVVINTSCNETGPVFLTKLPDNMLCLLQARNNVDNVLFETDSLEEFKEYFPLNKTYYTGEKELIDPETEYTRYMIIGRTGSKIDETVSTGQGGGSAGNGGAQMVGGPTTYEEEYGMFKSKGPRRITAMTNEALDSSYPYEEYSMGKYHFVTDTGVKYKVYLQGKDMVEVAFSAILPGEEENFRPDKTTLTGTGDSRKVFGTVVKIVKEYLDTHKPNALYFTAENSEPSRIKLYNRLIAQVDKELPDYKALGNVDLGSGTAYMLRRKEEVTEALDSSYEYVSGQKPGVFYFETEDGNQYKVDFSGNNKKTEIAFAQRGQGDEHKTGITGTGNSRKIFGTVINIVKDYISKAKPDMLIFHANNAEPSRVRLYKMLANQADSALPDYNFAKALSDGTYTTYYLTRNDVKVPALDKVKAAGFKALDKIVGESVDNKTTLTDIYNGNYPDHDELIWNYIGASDLDTPFTIETINPNMLNIYLTSQYRIEHIEELFDMMDEDQRETVEHYENDPTLSDQIIVMNNGRVIDGNHRALAAVLSNRPIKYIDVSEDEDESS